MDFLEFLSNLFKSLPNTSLEGSIVDPNNQYWGRIAQYYRSLGEHGYGKEDVNLAWKLNSYPPVFIAYYPEEPLHTNSETRWQGVLRDYSAINQKGLCVCGKQLDTYSQLHHALISKQDIRGIKDPVTRFFIHCALNVILLHPKCHEDITRAKSVVFLSEIYSREAVEHWYNHTVEALFPKTGLRHLFL